MTAAIIRAAGSLALAGLLICAVATMPSPAGAQTMPALSGSAPPALRPIQMRSTAENDDGPVDRRLLAIGAGAIVGVAAFNVLAAPFGTVPLAGAALAAVPESVMLGSRVIAAASAGAGALAAIWIYDQATGHQSDYGYLLTLGAGAIAGVGIGNLMTPGTGAMASAAAQAASRVYVITSAVLGAWAADWLHRSLNRPPLPPG
jgi:hypothetical protein